MRQFDPAEPIRRYQRDQPGELIHIDIKKLGKFSRTGHRITGDRTGQSNTRGIGWEFVHVCIDDASRIAYTQIMPDKKAVSVMSDNGSCYKAKAFAGACKRLKLKHIRTKPYPWCHS